MKNLLAQINLAPEGGFKGFGPLGLEKGTASDAPLVFNRFLTTIIGIMTVVAFIWFTIQLFIGAIALISSGGDKTKVAEARNKITTALIGVVIVIAAIFLIEVVGRVLGVEWILNPAVLIYQFVNQ